MAKYGVFSLGQLWSLHSSAGWVRGYPNRPSALKAAIEALAADDDQDSELLLQDETGFVAMAPVGAFRD
jgi:hypothetical protein